MSVDLFCNHGCVDGLCNHIYIDEVEKKELFLVQYSWMAWREIDICGVFFLFFIFISRDGEC